MTPTGPVPVESLESGDLVLAGDGSPTEVVGVYPQPEQPRYRVSLSDGTSVLTDADHLWEITSRRKKKVVRTADLIPLLRHGYWPVLPASGPADFAPRELLGEPYRMGLLLGDGSMVASGSTRITSADPEILALFEGTLYGDGITKGARGWLPALRHYGLHGLRSPEKHIPYDYLWSSAEDRLAVLQGLMDSDGGVEGAGSSFSSTSRPLSEGVQHLVRSLGGYAGPIRERVTYFEYPAGTRKAGLPSFRLNISAPFPLFRLQRKLDKQQALQTKRRWPYGRIVRSVTVEDHGPTTCIRVAHPSALFLTDNFVVTHNTHIAAKLALAFYDAFTPGTPCEICRGPCGGSKIVTMSSKEQHLKDNLWGEIRTAWNVLQQRVGMDGKLPPADVWINHTPNHFIMGQMATAAEGVQGYHGAHLLVVGDEAASVSDQVSQGITGILASGDARLLLIYNPTTPDTYAAQQSKLSRTDVIRITAFDTPEFTGEHRPPGAHFIDNDFLDDLKEQGCGPGTYEWQTKILAEFWDATDDTLVADKWYESALSQVPVPGHKAIGIDIASYGSSESTIAIRDGNSLVDLQAFPAGRVDHFFQGPVLAAVQRHQPNDVIYDADGVGAGAVGYAEALGRHLGEGRIIAFRGAKKYGDSYANSRSQWYWHLRRLFESGGISVLVNDDELRKQLTNIKYSIQAGAIKLETKAEMKHRGFKSPDRADSVYYAFSMSNDLYVPTPADDTVERTLGVRARPAIPRRDTVEPYDEWGDGCWDDW